jgi:hypothetical protein
VQGHHEHTKNHHNITNHLEIKIWHDHWKNLGIDNEYLIMPIARGSLFKYSQI